MELGIFLILDSLSLFMFIPIYFPFESLARKELQAPYQLLWSSRFLQIRLAQMLLGQLGNGWESIQDSFMISSLGWGPGDWDLFNVPISSF